MIKNKDEKKRDLINRVRENEKLKEQDFKNPPTAEILGNIEFPLCENELIGYDEKNNDFYIYYPEHKNNSRVHLVSIPVKFYGNAEDDQGTPYIDAKIDGNRHFYTFEEIRDAIKSHAVTGSHLEKIVEFLTLYMNNKDAKRLKIHPDGIYLDGDIICVDTPFNTINLNSTLEILYKLYVTSTSPDNFLINLAYFLISPLSYYFRKRNKLFPFLINSGQAHAGKTSIQLLFGNSGYGQDLLKSHFTRNDVKTYYTLMKSRAESILPITLEDVDIDWIRFQSTMLKGSAGTTNGGSRGYFNRVLKYESKSQLAFDTNDFVDVETAQLDRFIVCNFNADAAFRINISEFDRLKEQLLDGFMFSIFNAVFGGKKLSEIIENIYNVKDRDALKINIIQYVITEINQLMPENLHFVFPDFTILHNENNETDWFAEIYTTSKYLYDQFSADDRKGRIYEITEAQLDLKAASIYLTAGGYLLLQRHLNIPYNTISKIYNSVDSQDFDVKFTSHRFVNDDHPLKCLVITPKDGKKPDPPKGNEGPDNFNTDSLPDGPVKNSLREEQELKEFEKEKPENIQEKQATPQNVQKPSKIPKNPKMCYYKIMDHFDAYPDSYFDGSDIILDSYRPIYHKNSANVSYILVKVLIPENLSKQPGNWMKFLSDSQEISQKAFETLSRGDAE